MKTCSQCGLKNLNSAAYCNCGHEFSDGEEAQRETTAPPHPAPIDHEPDKVEATKYAEPRGLGGWLILPAFGLFFFPLQTAVLLNEVLTPFLQEGVWELLTTPGSEAYHRLGAPLVIMEILGNIALTLFDIILIFLFFSKSYRFPALYVTFVVVQLLFVATDFFLSELILPELIPAVAAEIDTESVRALLISIVHAVIWIPYFIVSERVENTFVKPESKV